MKNRIIKNMYTRIVIGGIVLFVLALLACPEPPSDGGDSPTKKDSIPPSPYSFSSSLAKVLYDAVKNEKVPADIVVNGDKSGVAGIIFKGLGATAGDTLSVIHVDDSGNDANNGSTWTKAKRTIKDALDDITDASATKLYLVLIGEGTYTPKAPLEMKNYVAIIGGFDASSNEESGYESNTATVISGGGRVLVFNNTSLDTATNSTAVLAGVTITNGKGVNGGGMSNYKSSPTITHTTFSGNNATKDGGGMDNSSSSPTIMYTTFSENTAAEGGGMSNSSSSPTITHTTFSGNKARYGGGGMDNSLSSPTIMYTTFSGNKAHDGGGMDNYQSSPTITYTTFSGNNAAKDGGGMDNNESSPTITHTTFSGNNATKDGGGIYNDKNSSPIISSSIFWGNNASQIKDAVNSKPEIAHSIVQGGYGVDDSTNNIIDQDPLLDTLKNNGGFVETIAISAKSPAINEGLYVARKGKTIYYSKDETDWFTSPTLSAATKEANFPADAKRYTTDARGYTYDGRPDMGAYEYKGTAP